MKVVFTQSNYIPWRGYFDLIDDADLFVYYDHVQYTRQDWRNRNLIKTPNGPIWLTVPVHGSINLRVQEVELNTTQPWVNKHIRSLRFSYSRAPYFSEYAESFFSLLGKNYKYLSKLNIALNQWLMGQLRITTQTKTSSEVLAGYTGADLGATATDRLLSFLKLVGATEYLTGPAAKNYLEEEKFDRAGIGLEFKSYQYSEYPQLFGTFAPNVSVLDLLFNCGKDSIKHLKSTCSTKKAI